MSDKRVIVVGGGIGGVQVAKKLGATLISDSRMFTFVPRLPDVLFSHDSCYANIPIEEVHDQFIFGKVTRVDAQKKEVILQSGKHIAYDELVLATGATSYIPLEGAQRYAIPFYSSKDVLRIREKVKDIERVVIVGAGPTGVEVAGEIAEHTNAAVALLQRDSVILPTYSPRARALAKKRLEKLGVQVICDCDVSQVTKRHVIGTEKISYDVLIWTAGVQANIVGGVPHGRGVSVDEYLRVVGLKDVWALGDCAQSGTPLTAQAALDEAKTVVHNILATRCGGTLRKDSPNHKGSFLTVGSWGLVDSFVTFSGRFARQIRHTYYNYVISKYKR